MADLPEPPHNDVPDIDRIIHIDNLKDEARQLTDGEMVTWESDKEAPLDVVEQFWEQVVEYEKAPLTSDYVLLTEAGLELPPPESMDSAALSAKLDELIQAMAKIRSYLYQTDHLSDRELYTQLLDETLHEARAAVPGQDGAWIIDMLGSYGPEDIRLHLKYYASEDERRDHAERWPEDEIADHADPPYDRDRHLPNPGF